MEQVSVDAEKVYKKQKTFHKSSIDYLDNFIKFLSQQDDKSIIEEHLNSFTLVEKETSSSDGIMLKKKAEETSEAIQSVVKDYYNALGKLSKAIDKKFSHNLELVGDADVFQGKEREMEQAIAYHLIREGYFDYSDLFCNESKLKLPEGLREKFADMFTILKAINQHNLQPALEWARNNRQLLEKRGSNLEFRLHQLQFIIILLDQSQTSGQRTMQALTYAKREFPMFGERHMKEIQKLMGCICYTNISPFSVDGKTVGGSSSGRNPLLQSPYADLITDNMWTEIEDCFAREFCTLLGLAQESPLTVTTNVGAAAIPVMIKLRNVLDKRKGNVEMWSVDRELPVEVPLLKKQRYHSIFACPVSREQTNKLNPPFMLTCGHVISKESLIRLCKGKSQLQQQQQQQQQPLSIPINTTNSNNSGDGEDAMQIEQDPMAGIPMNAKIKCPYCPTETMASQSLLVHF